MQMKKFLLVTLAAAAALLACSKNSTEAPEGGQSSLNVRIRAGNPGTKAGTTVSENDEAKVSRIEVLVFNSGGGLDAYKSSDGSGLKVEGISTSSGSKTVVAVVNAPASAKINEVTDIEALRGKTSLFKADNDPDNFVMYGEKSVYLTPTGTNDVSVDVSRLAARIRIDKVTRKFRSEMSGLVDLPASEFEVVRFYLTNVADEVNYGSPVGGAVAVSNWLTDETPHNASPAASVAIDKDALVYSPAKADGGANLLAQNGEYSNIHRLYAYPNSSTSQITKLVVECKIDGKYYTYPIAYEELKSNYSYEIRNLTVTRLGHNTDGDDNIDPDEQVDPIVTLDFDCEIVVNPWNLVLMGPDGDGNITI